MKLEAEKYRYPFPGDRLEVAAFWDKDPEQNPDAMQYPLTQIGSSEIVRLHADDKAKLVSGYPVYVAILCGELWVYPKPEKDMLARVRYSTTQEL